MKKSWLFLLGLFFVSFVSAAYYGGFSVGNLFANLNPNDVFLGVAFLLFLFFLNLAFSRFSKDKYGNPSRAAWVPALALSVGLTYGLSRASFDLSSFFYSLGFTEDVLMAFLGIVLVVGMIYAIKKKKFKYFLIGFGAFFIVLSFTELVYEKGAAAIIGGVLILLGSRFWRIFGIFKKKDKVGGGGERDGVSNNPRGEGPFSDSERKLRNQGIERLIREARRYRKWAKSTNNPKYYLNWAHFVNFLKGQKYGSNEAGICLNLHVTKKDIVKIVKRYVR